MFQLFEHAGDEIIDGVVAQDMKQYKQIWYLREQVAVAGVKLGYVSFEPLLSDILPFLVLEIRRLPTTSRLLHLCGGHS